MKFPINVLKKYVIECVFQKNINIVTKKCNNYVFNL